MNKHTQSWTDHTRTHYLLVLGEIIFNLIAQEKNETRLSLYGKLTSALQHIFDKTGNKFYHTLGSDLHKLALLKLHAFRETLNRHAKVNLRSSLILNQEKYIKELLVALKKKLPVSNAESVKHNQSRTQILLSLAVTMYELITQERDKSWLELYKELTHETIDLFDVEENLHPDLGFELFELILFKLDTFFDAEKNSKRVDLKNSNVVSYEQIVKEMIEEIQHRVHT